MKIIIKASGVIHNNISYRNNNYKFSSIQRQSSIGVNLIDVLIQLNEHGCLLFPNKEILQAKKEELAELTTKLASGYYFLQPVGNNTPAKITADITMIKRIIYDDVEAVESYSFNNLYDFLDYFNSTVDDIISPVPKIKPKL